MKKLILLLSLLCSSQVFSQVYYTFNSLDGLEDKEGNTQLIYRKYYLSKAEYNYSEENSIYRYDVNKNKDTLIAADYLDEDPIFTFYQSVNDISFFDNNPFEYIYCGGNGTSEAHGYICTSDSGYTFGALFMFVDRIEVSKQNPQRVFASALGEMVLSTDRGMSWPIYSFSSGFTSSKDFFLLSAFPKDDKIMLGLKGNHLVKSLDTGTTFVEVDTAVWVQSSRFYYDMDNAHIYGSSNGYNGYSFISVSDNKGDAFSWKKIWESQHNIFISVDQSILVGPLLYLADGKNIFLSSDYGKTFLLFQTLDKNIVGIYKKLGSGILYAATKYNLYEITSNEMKIIKSLPPSPETLSYYPLAVGNKWNLNIFERVYETIGSKDYNGMMTREVIGDTLLPNGNKYFIIEQKESLHSPSRDSQYFLERVDSTTGKIFRYDSTYNTPPQDLLIDDLTAEVGDTLELYRYNKGNTPQVIYKGNEQKYFDNQILDRKMFHFPNSLYYSGYSLTKGIGLDSLSAGFDLGYINYWLKGCVINWKVIGDTSLVVGITDENQNIPSEFALFRNYPNPFNPITTIKYQIAEKSFVTLKIFDVVGGEVATLVNEEKEPGIFEVQFKGSNFSSGVYFYKLTAGNFSQTMKFILMK
ncbi:MAG: T9SS type A sorting domain-containing protein [Ignavibacteriaceae bacterium]